MVATGTVVGVGGEVREPVVGAEVGGTVVIGKDAVGVGAGLVRGTVVEAMAVMATVKVMPVAAGVVMVVLMSVGEVLAATLAVTVGLMAWVAKVVVAMPAAMRGIVMRVHS